MCTKAEIVQRLETERLWLRRLCSKDAEDLFDYAKSPSVGPSAGWEPHKTLEESRKCIDYLNSCYAVWAIVWKENGKVIGSIGFNASHKNGFSYDKELGYALSEDYQGKGIMTEAALAVIDYAFKVLKLKNIGISHFDFNDRSRRVIEKCGFHYVVTLPLSWTRYDGVTLDEVCYILKNPYL